MNHPVENIPSWAAYLAQDADGTWWAYEAHPNEMHNGWYENEVGRIRKLAKTVPPEDCFKTLVKLK